MTDLTGKKLGVYEVRQLIGRGGMAAVWSAYHPTTAREVAIKVLLPDASRDESFRKRFEREARTLAGLQHIHILPVFDYGQEGDIAYLVMPLLPGTTLLHELRDGYMEPKEVVRIFRQLAGALDYAHARGLLHRDIKPGNVLLDDSGNAVLADFGLTRMVDSSAMSRLTSDSSVVGTPAYMSPEQGQGLDLDHRSDLYSMGVMLYEMLTGHVPYRADTPVAIIFKHITEPVPRLKQYRDDLPEAVEAVLQKTMAKLPPDRYSSATAMVDALEDAIEGRAAPLLSDHPSMMTPPLLDKPDFPNGINTLDFGMRPKRKRDERNLTGTVLKALLIAGFALVIAFAGIIGVTGGMISQSALPVGTKTPAIASENLTQINAGSEVIALAFNANSSRIMAGLKDNTAGIWDIATQKRLFTLEAHAGDVLSVAYSPDGAEVLTGGADNTYFKWDADDGSTLITGLEGSAVRGVAYSPNYYAYITREHLAAGKQTSRTGVGFFKASPAKTTLISLAFSPDETLIATGDDDGSVFLWETASGTVISTFQSNVKARQVSVAFTPDGSTVLAADENGVIRFWAIDPDASAEQPTTHTEPVYTMPTTVGLTSMALSPDGSLIATTHPDGSLRLWSGETHASIVLFADSELPLNKVIFSADGKWLASGGDGSFITIRAVSDMEPPTPEPEK